MEPIPKLREIRMDEIGVDFEEIIKGYLAVKARDLFPDTTLPFDIHLLSLSRNPLRLFLKKVWARETLYTPSLHEGLMKEEVGEVYIREEDEDAFFRYLSGQMKRIIGSPDVPIDRKAPLLYDSAEMIVKKAFEEKPTPANVRIGRQFIKDFTTVIASEDLPLQALLSLFSKDYGTFTHSVQVALLGMCFCRHLKWDQERVMEFGLGALFHDVGKSGIDDAILNKPTKLDKQDFELIKRHVTLGYVQLKNTQVLSKTQLNVVLQHHEAMDGSGYPYGLKGTDIHEVARIAKIIDCFDALTTKRVYKDALLPAQALQVMLGEMKASFDPALLRSFVMFLGQRGQKGSAVPEKPQPGASPRAR